MAIENAAEEDDDEILAASRRKLEGAANAFLPVLLLATGSDGDAPSSSLSSPPAAPPRQQQLPLLRSLPCASYDDASSYRCRCSFQVVCRDDDDDGGGGGVVQYAVRTDHKPVVVLPGDAAAHKANRRIRRCMSNLQNALNGDLKQDDDKTASECLQGTSVLKHHLSSVSFSTSWYDGEGGGDCVVTMNYGAPIEDRETWRRRANRLCREIGASHVAGRSRGRVTRTAAADPSLLSPVLRDCLVLTKRRKREKGANRGAQSNHLPMTTNGTTWTVEVVPYNVADEQESGEQEPQQHEEAVRVYYEKPEGAFCHPNAGVMCKALEWILNRITYISLGDNGCAACSGSSTKPSLLELYCGCGAHTMALLRSKLLESIVAVELDERLVTAFRRNCELNGIDLAIPSSNVEIVSGDAGKYADAAKLGGRPFEILLVDPPKCGLDSMVRTMALHGTFEHVLYISCGKDALVRDLQLLTGSGEEPSNASACSFDVADFLLLDLFPGTYAVESLVHLRRQRSN